jgi:hypothetical protein
MGGHPTFKGPLRPKEIGAHKQGEWAETQNKRDVKATSPIIIHALQDHQMEHNIVQINDRGR